MRGLTLKSLSIEKKMTLLLPVVTLLALAVSILAVSRVRYRAADADPRPSRPVVAGSVAAAQPVSILLLLGEETPDFMAVAHIRPSGALVTVSAVDPAIPLPRGTAAQVYRDGGAAALQTELARLLGLTLDFYADFSYAGLRRLIRHYGNGVTVTLPQPVSRTDASGLSVFFPMGEMRLSDQQAYELMRSVAGCEPACRLAAVSSLWCGLVNGYWTADRELSQDFSALCAACDTDIKIFHWERYLPALQAMTAYAPLAVETPGLAASADPAAVADWRQLLIG